MTAIKSRTATSQGDTWLIHFTYHHSTHSVVMNLGELTAEQPSKTSIDSTTVLIMTIAVVAALAIALEVATARRKNHN